MKKATISDNFDQLKGIGTAKIVKFRFIWKVVGIFKGKISGLKRIISECSKT